MKTLRISLPITAAFLAFFVVLASGYVLKDIVEKAEAELKDEILKQVERGATTKVKVARKKVTPE